MVINLTFDNPTNTILNVNDNDQSNNQYQQKVVQNQLRFNLKKNYQSIKKINLSIDFQYAKPKEEEEGRRERRQRKKKEEEEDC